MRLAIVEQLAASDRSPGELAVRLSLPSNLMSHHLDVLTGVGLIERLASAGDRRRRYVRLLPAGFDAIGSGGARRPERAMFVCTHNSARSQLAAAIWSQRTGDESSSAGTSPAPRVHPGAVAAARRAGLDLADAAPTRLGRITNDVQVITVCDRAHEELEPGHRAWHWSMPDPVEIGTSAAFDATVADLDTRISKLTSTKGTR